LLKSLFVYSQLCNIVNLERIILFMLNRKLCHSKFIPWFWLWFIFWFKFIFWL